MVTQTAESTVESELETLATQVVKFNITTVPPVVKSLRATANARAGEISYREVYEQFRAILTERDTAPAAIPLQIRKQFQIGEWQV